MRPVPSSVGSQATGAVPTTKAGKPVNDEQWHTLTMQVRINAPAVEAFSLTDLLLLADAIAAVLDVTHVDNVTLIPTEVPVTPPM